MAAFGLSYDKLRALNPALVYCSITGYGQTGHYRERPGYDYVVQAMSGLMSITGPADGAPYKVGVAISDVIAGLFAANAVQAALRHAEQTGQGQFIDVSLLDTQLAALVNIASNYLVSGQVPPRLGNQHPNIVPYQTFAAADGEFVVAVGNDRQFKLLCNLIDRPELAEDSRFSTNPARVQNRDALIPLLQAIFETRPADDWVNALLAEGIPAGPINTVGSALDDPHVRARDMVETVTLPNQAQVDLIASPLRLSETPTLTRLPPPALGQHTDAILSEVLGYDAEAVARLHVNGVV
jgi:formyl-CoA transferase